MSMLGANDKETRSYLEFVDALRQHGAAPKEDMRALWRRIVFSVLISNTDDHLRNHGFLYTGPDGWRLAPAYDLNPVPTDIKPRVLATAIDLDDGTASLDRAMDVAGYFELDARNGAGHRGRGRPGRVDVAERGDAVGSLPVRDRPHGIRLRACGSAGRARAAIEIRYRGSAVRTFASGTPSTRRAIASRSASAPSRWNVRWTWVRRAPGARNAAGEDVSSS